MNVHVARKDPLENALLRRAMKLGLLETDTKKSVGVTADGSQITMLRLKNGEIATPQNIERVLEATTAIDVKWYPKVTPEAVIEEMWATWLAMKSKHILAGLPNTFLEAAPVQVFDELPGMWANAIATATPMIIEADVAEKHTTALSPALSQRKWRQKPVSSVLFNSIYNTRALYISFTRCVRGEQIADVINGSYTNVKTAKQTLRNKLLYATVLFAARSAVRGNFISGVSLFIEPGVDKPLCLVLPPVFCDGLIEHPCATMVFEALEFAFSTRSEHTFVAPNLEEIPNTAQRGEHKPTFIPEITIVQLRRSDRSTNARNEPTGLQRNIHFAQEVGSYQRILRNGRVVPVRSFTRYRDLPPRPGERVYHLSK